MDKEQLKEKYGDEKVLCIPTSHYAGNQYGFKNLLASIITDGSYNLRYEVENDETLLQVIPYVVVKHSDNFEGTKYFITKRLAGDERLKGMVAFLGGHIDESDKSTFILGNDIIEPVSTINNGFYRELQEETTINYRNIINTTTCDVFVDTRQPVSKVHICLLLIVDIDTFDIKISETDKLEGVWASLEELKEIKDSGKVEGWAEIAIQYLMDMNTKEDVIDDNQNTTNEEQDTTTDDDTTIIEEAVEKNGGNTNE